MLSSVSCQYYSPIKKNLFLKVFFKPCRMSSEFIPVLCYSWIDHSLSRHWIREQCSLYGCHEQMRPHSAPPHPSSLHQVPKRRMPCPWAVLGRSLLLRACLLQKQSEWFSWAMTQQWRPSLKEGNSVRGGVAGVGSLRTPWKRMTGLQPQQLPGWWGLQPPVGPPKTCSSLPPAQSEQSGGLYSISLIGLSLQRTADWVA